MTTIFVSRHAGTVAWAKKHGIEADLWVDHLNTAIVHSGDTVIGTISMAAAAEICRKGAVFFAFDIPLKPEQRGRELSLIEINQMPCRLQQYQVITVANNDAPLYPNACGF